MRILVVEDEHAIQSLLRNSLVEVGYQVDAAENASAATLLAAENKYDGMIVDLGLPDQDGMELILQLRASGLKTPVLILSARRSVDDRVKGLELGGDDYLTKPFAIAELLARMNNLIRRSSVSKADAVHFKIMDMEVDLLRRKATRAGEILNLSPLEFSLLEYLCRHAGHIVTRSMLLSEVWGMRIQPDTNVVDVHIYRLRGKVDAGDREPLIQTLRGIGYVLREK